MSYPSGEIRPWQRIPIQPWKTPTCLRYGLSARKSPTTGRKGDWSLPKPPVLSNGPDAFALWKGFCRRWPLALILGTVLATLAFGAVFFLLPERFKGFALLQVSSSKPSLSLDGVESRGDFQTYLKTQAARIKSRDVLMKALNQDAVRNLARRAKASRHAEHARLAGGEPQDRDPGRLGNPGNRPVRRGSHRVGRHRERTHQVLPVHHRHVRRSRRRRTASAK